MSIAGICETITGAVKVVFIGDEAEDEGEDSDEDSDEDKDDAKDSSTLVLVGVAHIQINSVNPLVSQRIVANIKTSNGDCQRNFSILRRRAHEISASCENLRGLW